MYNVIYIYIYIYISILFIFLLLQEYTITNLYLQLPSIPSPISQLTMQHSTDGDVFQSTRGSLFLDHGTCPRGLCTVMGQDVPVCMSVCACIHCTCVCVCVCVLSYSIYDVITISLHSRCIYQFTTFHVIITYIFDVGHYKQLFCLPSRSHLLLF